MEGITTEGLSFIELKKKKRHIFFFFFYNNGESYGKKDVGKA